MEHMTVSLCIYSQKLGFSLIYFLSVQRSHPYVATEQTKAFIRHSWLQYLLTCSLENRTIRLLGLWPITKRHIGEMSSNVYSINKTAIYHA